MSTKINMSRIQERTTIINQKQGSFNNKMSLPMQRHNHPINAMARIVLTKYWRDHFTNAMARIVLTMH